MLPKVLRGGGERQEGPGVRLADPEAKDRQAGDGAVLSPQVQRVHTQLEQDIETTGGSECLFSQLDKIFSTFV